MSETESRSDPRRARHFRWEEMEPDRPMDALLRRQVVGERVMLNDVRLEEGCYVPLHEHENEQFAFVLEGEILFELGAPDSPDRRELVVGAGELLHLPSWVPHAARALRPSRVLDVFSPPSEATGIDRD